MSESKTHKVLQADPEVEARVGELLGKLTLGEKIGQMSQWSAGWQPGVLDEQARGAAESGMAGSFLNASGELRNELQRKALQTRLGIPLIFGRDVIHGYRTIFPIPLGQAASFNPELAEQGSEVAAREAASQGIDWTFAPMVDIARDPRWGRVAEGGGEDPVLASSMGAAWVRGFQGEDLRAPERLAACAKHYVGYGAAEAGKDYNTTEISERTLREVYLPSFKACVKAGAAT
ncbi:MAG TPA: glycoside hydrolase family 3 N-terminal domain-containing protein, partial [Polyangiaceae bacterium]